MLLPTAESLIILQLSSKISLLTSFPKFSDKTLLHFNMQHKLENVRYSVSKLPYVTVFNLLFRQDRSLI